MENWDGGGCAKLSLIAVMDCMTDGKILCEKARLMGFPTIKLGNPSKVGEYEGGRDHGVLKQLHPHTALQNLSCVTTTKRNQDVDEHFEADPAKTAGHLSAKNCKIRIRSRKTIKMPLSKNEAALSWVHG